MSSFWSILCGYTKNNFSPCVDNWEEIAKHYCCPVEEEDVWMMARECEKFPQIENIYQSILLSNLESIFIEKSGCDWEDVDFFTFINCRDTHFSINGSPVTSLVEFERALRKAKKKAFKKRAAAKRVN